MNRLVRMLKSTWIGLISNKVCVIIPVHSERPSKEELWAFRQCFKILGKYPIKVLTNRRVDLRAYRMVKPVFDTIYIDEKWQSSYVQYNKLKISSYFYDLFKRYKYLLTYELDSFVFKDELLMWCNKSYDYIGAPWMEEDNQGKLTVTAVGNSGFSLRKVSSCRKILRQLRNVEVLEDYKNLNLKGLLAHFPKLFFALQKARKSESDYVQKFEGHEDGFWCIHSLEKLGNFSCNSDLRILFGTAVNPKFKIAPEELAMEFSFEKYPRHLFQRNRNRLPFGCHAWEKYDKQFWVPFIEHPNSINE